MYEIPERYKAKFKSGTVLNRACEAYGDYLKEEANDKYVSDQKKLLDELKQDYKKALDDRMDNVDVLISDAIASINSSILTPLTRDVSVLNADMTKNLWDFMGNPGSFLSDYSDGFVNSEKYSTKNEESNVNIASVFDNVTFNLPNVIDSNAFVRELVTNKKAERAIQAMTIDRIRGGSSLAKNKYKH